MDHFDIALIGGDRRIAHVAPILLQEGCRVTCFGITDVLTSSPGLPKPLISHDLRECLSSAGTVICGIPLERNGVLCCEADAPIPLSQLQRGLRRHQKLFGGLLSEEFRHHCEERSISCHDFMKDESLALFNAVCTAEGAILEALSHKESLLHQSNCLVLGFGRCGSMIARRLAGLCAKVTVTSAEPTELAMAQSAGHEVFPLSDLPKQVSRFDYLFNTIPACYLGEESLPSVRRDCLIIDVASGRLGVDYDMAKKLSLQALFCPGLPGKYAAESCAQRLVKYVLEHIDESKESKTWKGA